MRSTEKIHKICEAMPVDDRKAMMQELLDLRITILDEVAGTVNNSKKLLKLFYSKQP